MATTSTSSLLRSAASRQAKLLSLQDQEAAFVWESSAQTYQDYQAYAQYLTDKGNTTTDPSQSLTYASKLRTATNSYVGNEIQRQTQDVIEGSSTNTAKYQKLTAFYYQAQDAGNLNLAQNIRSQLDSLSVTIQNEQQAGQALAKSMAAERVTNLQDYVSAQQDIIKQWGNIYSQYGAAGLNDSLHQFSQAQGLKSDISYFDVIAGILGIPDANGTYPPDSIIGALQTGASGLDAVNANKLKLDINKVLDGTTKFSMPGLPDITYSDVMDALDAQRAGQNIYALAQDSNGKNIFVKNKLDNYTWGQDANGQMRLIRTYDPRGDSVDTKSFVLKKDAKGQMLDSSGKVTKDPAKAERLSYKDVIEAAGFKVLGTNSDGSIQLAHGDSAGTNLDVTGGGEFSAVIDDSGAVRFVHSDAAGNKSLYRVVFDANGAANLSEFKAEDTSVFGDTGYYKSHASDTGEALIKQLIGQSDVNFDPMTPSSITSLPGANGYSLADVNPYARPLNTSDILKQGEITSRLQAVATDKLLQNGAVNPQFQAAPSLQASSTFDLNRTAVPANAGLKVTNAPPQPKLIVSAPAPTPAITNVGVAQPTQKISSVGVAQPTGHVSVGH